MKHSFEKYISLLGDLATGQLKVDDQEPVTIPITAGSSKRIAAVVALFTSAESWKTSLESTPCSCRKSQYRAYAGGLIDHMYETTVKGIRTVMTLFPEMQQAEPTFYGCDIDIADLVEVAAYHALGKTGDLANRYYQPKMVKASRKKDETEMVQSDTTPFEVVPECFKLVGEGQTDVWNILMARTSLGERSLYVLRGLGIKLSEKVEFAIQHTSGMYGEGASGYRGKETPLALIMHTVTMLDTLVSE